MRSSAEAEEPKATFQKFLTGLGRFTLCPGWLELPGDIYWFGKARVLVQFHDSSEAIGPYRSLRAETLGNLLESTCREQSFSFFRLHADDWVRRQSAIQNWLRHKLGKSNRLCAARQAALHQVPTKEARAFYDQYHLQGGSVGKHFGLRYQDQWVACMTFNPYNPGRGGCLEKHAYNLIRFATAGHVPGAATRLFRFACTTLEAQQVVTFSDRTYARGRPLWTTGLHSRRLPPAGLPGLAPKVGTYAQGPLAAQPPPRPSQGAGLPGSVRPPDRPPD